jgi:hypothetical protein
VRAVAVLSLCHAYPGKGEGTYATVYKVKSNLSALTIYSRSELGSIKSNKRDSGIEGNSS